MNKESSQTKYFKKLSDLKNFSSRFSILLGIISECLICKLKLQIWNLQSISKIKTYEKIKLSKNGWSIYSKDERPRTDLMTFRIVLCLWFHFIQFHLCYQEKKIYLRKNILKIVDRFLDHLPPLGREELKWFLQEILEFHLKKELSKLILTLKSFKNQFIMLREQLWFTFA
jgi:hypothetical protein